MIALALAFLAGGASGTLIYIAIQHTRIANAAEWIARNLDRIAAQPPPAIPHAAEAPAAQPPLHAIGGRE